MKKTLILCFVMSLISVASIAQNKGLLTFSLGPAIPIWDFADKTGKYTVPGWADAGAMVDLSYRHPIGHNHFGWMASLYGRTNPVDKAAYVSANNFNLAYVGFDTWSMSNGRGPLANATIR